MSVAGFCSVCQSLTAGTFSVRYVLRVEFLQVAPKPCDLLFEVVRRRCSCCGRVVVVIVDSASCRTVQVIINSFRIRCQISEFS